MKRFAITLFALVISCFPASAEACKNCITDDVVGKLLGVLAVFLVLLIGIPIVVFKLFNSFSGIKRKNVGATFIVGFFFNLGLVNILMFQLHLFGNEDELIAGYVFFLFTYIIFCIVGYYLSPKQQPKQEE